MHFFHADLLARYGAHRHADFLKEAEQYRRARAAERAAAEDRDRARGERRLPLIRRRRALRAEG